MNFNCFKVVFSKHLGICVAVGEHVSNQGKCSDASASGGVAFEILTMPTLAGFVGKLTASFALMGLAWAEPTGTALPTGGQVMQGMAGISQSGAVMNINQASARAVINWNSFDIGSQAQVNVNQPSTQGVLLSRVTGANPSQIFGQLNANGQVVLVNPNGVLFGKDGSVNANSFTASTLGISDANFMAGNMQYERSGATAGVVNQGRIKTTGGYVALLSASVSNEGSIQTQGGAAYLVAAETVKIPVSGSGRIKLELSPTSINAAVANAKGGTIVTEGGQVYMQAAALNNAVASIIQSGSIDTTGTQGGAVHLLADGGGIKVDGSITANSKDENNNARKGGDIVIGRNEETGALAKATDVSGATLQSLGGFVETSGQELKFNDVSVQAKDWLLDPQDVTIDATNAGTIGTNLGTTNITIQTTGATLGTTAAGTGNITVNSAITKAAAAGAETTLTLSADNSITVNAAIGTATGAGKLNVVMTANGQTDGVAVGSMTAAQRALSRGIFINATSINTNGGDLTLSGTSYADATTANNVNASATNAVGKGIQLHSTTSLTAKNITITGTAENQTGNISYGVVFQRWPNAQTLTATGDITIMGTLNGAGNGSAVNFAQSGWGAYAPMITAGGKFTLRANNRGASSNTAAALMAGTGMQVRAVGDIVVQAETNNAAANSMYFVSNSYSGGSFTATAPGALYGNTSFRSIDASGNASSNVLIQSNQGCISLDNALDPTLTLGSLTALTDIKGKNVTIDNTGAGMATGSGALVGSGGTTGSTIGAGSITVNATTGDVTVSKGIGKASSGQGLLINDGRSITATQNLNIIGASSASLGIQTGTGALSGGGVNLDGSSDTHIGVYMAGANGTLSSTVGDVTIVGTSGSSAGASNTAVNLVNAITAQKNVSIKGTNTNAANTQAAVYANHTITATQGTIGVTADTAGTTNQALTLNSAATLKTTAEQNISLTADTMNLVGTINAGVGIVTLQNNSAGVKIDIGSGTSSSGVDVGGSTAGSRTLGLASAELNKITAGKTVIGSETAGNVTLSAATTTAAATGDVTVQTGANIAINAALTVGGTTPTKNLTLNGAGSTSAITQSAAIKAAGLELLGADATHTLGNSGNDIKKLAGNTKVVSLTNNAAFGIDTVNTAGLSTSGNTTLSSTGTVTQAQALRVGALELLGSGGSYSLNNAGNGMTKLAGNTGTVSLTTGGDLAIDTVNSAGLTATGNVSLTTMASGSVTLKKNITASASTVTLDAAGSVLRDGAAAASDGIVKATAWVVKAGGSVGTAASRIKTEVGSLSADSGTDQYITEADAVTLAAKAGGKIDIATTNGTLIVGKVSGLTGVSATGSGNIVLAGNTTGGIGMRVNANITGNAGVDISGTANTSWGLGVQGATIQASGPISLTGKTGDGQDLGVLIWQNSAVIANASSAYADGANAISIRGLTPTNGYTSASGRNVVINSNSSITNNSNNGDTSIYGQSTQISVDGGTTITNASSAGKIKMLADNNAFLNVGVEANKPLAKITQNSSKGILIESKGNGSLLVPTIVNNGGGDVVIAAGSGKLAGDGTGGQVITVSGSAVAQNGQGKTYIYTGTASGTSTLSLLSSDLTDLYLSDVGANLQNADSHAAYGSRLSNGTRTQAFFRESLTLPDITLTADITINKTYGEASTANDPSTPLLAELRTALKNTNVGNVTSTKPAGVFHITKSALIDDLSEGDLKSASYSSSNFLNANVVGYSFEALRGQKYGSSLLSVASSAKVIVNPKALDLVGLGVLDKTYDGTDSAELSGNASLGTVSASNNQPTDGKMIIGDNVKLTGTARGHYDSKDVLGTDGNGANTVTVSGLSLTESNATGRNDPANYVLKSKTFTANKTIKPADLWITANDDSKLVTTNDTPGYAGVTFTGANGSGNGFVNGENESALSGQLTISRSNSSNNASGDYAGVLVPAGYASSNYKITYIKGNYTIVPFDEILVKTKSTTITYGADPEYDTTAEYVDSSTNTIVRLTRSGNNGNYTFTDPMGGKLIVSLKPMFFYGFLFEADKGASGKYVVGSYEISDPDYVKTGSINFLDAPVFAGTLDIVPKNITITALNANSKPYDGNKNAVISGATFSGLVGDETLKIKGVGVFNSKNVIPDNRVTVDDVSTLTKINGTGDWSNYSLTSTSISSPANITAKPVTLTASSVSKPYDGTATYSLQPEELSVLSRTLIDNDAVTAATLRFAQKDVGNNKVVSFDRVIVDDGNGGKNYNITLAGNSSSSIIQNTTANVVLTAKSALVSYNGTTQSVSGFDVTGLLGDDALNSQQATAGITAAAAGRNAGTYATTLEGNNTTLEMDYANITRNSGSLTISPKSVTLTAPGVSKEYDGVVGYTVRKADLEALSSQLVGNDAVTAATLAYTDKNAGIGIKKITLSDVRIEDGNNSQNYILTLAGNSASTITPKKINVLLSAADKTYDGTNTAYVTGASTDILGNDAVQLSGTKGAFESKNVVKDAQGNVLSQTVLVSANSIALSGSDAQNYSVGNIQNFDTLKATIHPKEITPVFSANDKTYDGNNLASVVNVENVGVLAGDKMTVSQKSATFASLNVSLDSSGHAAAQSVLISGLYIAGTDAVNYQLASPTASAQAKITPKILSINGSHVADKVENGLLDASIVPGKLVGLVGNDNLFVSASGFFRTAFVGNAKPVDVNYSLNDIHSDNGLARNYILPPEVLYGNILSIAGPNPVQPFLIPATATSKSSRVFFSAPFAEKNKPINLTEQQACSISSSENCECSKIAPQGVELCFASQ